jgi:hypothetical protein
MVTCCFYVFFFRLHSYYIWIYKNASTKFIGGFFLHFKIVTAQTWNDNNEANGVWLDITRSIMIYHSDLLQPKWNLLKHTINFNFHSSKDVVNLIKNSILLFFLQESYIWSLSLSGINEKCYCYLITDVNRSVSVIPLKFSQSQLSKIRFKMNY